MKVLIKELILSIRELTHELRRYNNYCSGGGGKIDVGKNWLGGGGGGL